MLADLPSIILWWLTLCILGIFAYPITSRLFSSFADRGYAFSKVIGILLTSYVVWFAGSLHILPFERLSILIVLLGWILISLWGRKDGRYFSKSAHPWRWIIIEELFFFATLTAWSYVRATEPSIHGLEKFMDYGFVQSILRSQYFPPLDMWLAQSPDYAGGHFINYYYYGHYVAAFLTKLSGIDSAITYNLMMATLFAFTFTLPFSLGMNLLYLFRRTQHTAHNTKREKNTSASSHNPLPTPLHDKPSHNLSIFFCGLLAAFLVSLGGNLHTIYTFTTGYTDFENPEPFWKLSFGFHPDKYWYPNATRFIPNTIHEFPLYSFVVADLHGHVSDIPFVLLVLAVLLSLLSQGSVFGIHPHNHESERKHAGKIEMFFLEFSHRTGIPLPYAIILGLLLAVCYMTNAWDGLIYFIFTACVLVFLHLRTTSNIWLALRSSFSALLFIGFVFLLANLPFSLQFKPFVSGVGVLCAPQFLANSTIGPFLFEENHCQRSPFYMLSILWGSFYYAVLGWGAFVLFPMLRSLRQTPQEKKGIGIRTRIATVLRAPLTLVLTLSFTDGFVLIVILISTLLLLFPELFYLKDIYPAHYRANTMFKLGYQAFMMLGIISAYTLFRIQKRDLPQTHHVPYLWPLAFRLWKLGFLLVFLLVAIYPYFAISSYYDRLRTYHGLYGLNWLQTQYPDDYAAIQWLQTTVPGQPVIVEANGESYTDYARVSANIGLPTIVGWPVHEWLWRGSYDEAGKRIPEVQTIYESTDLAQVQDILKKYNVQYVFVGDLEREKYKALTEERLKALGTVVFESGQTRIYRIQQ